MAILESNPPPIETQSDNRKNRVWHYVCWEVGNCVPRHTKHRPLLHGYLQSVNHVVYRLCDELRRYRCTSSCNIPTPCHSHIIDNTFVRLFLAHRVTLAVTICHKPEDIYGLITTTVLKALCVLTAVTFPIVTNDNLFVAVFVEFF